MTNLDEHWKHVLCVVSGNRTGKDKKCNLNFTGFVYLYEFDSPHKSATTLTFCRPIIHLFVGNQRKCKVYPFDQRLLSNYSKRYCMTIRRKI